MKKRLLALALALCLIMSMLPMSAFAAGNGVTTPDLPICDHKNTTSTTVDATCQAAGSITVTCDDCGEVISTTPIEQLVHTAGTCENCAITLAPDAATTLTVGTWIYVARGIGGMTATFTNVTSVIYNEVTYSEIDDYGNIVISDIAAMGRTPVYFTVTVGELAEGDEATASFAFPVGHPQNPDTLYMGSNTATVAANNTNGYNYTWTATHTGDVTITMPVGSGWAYQWNNITANSYGDVILSDTVDAVHTYTVTAGDEITLMVNSYDPESWNNPAATIEFTANYPAGSEANPIMLNVPGPNALAAGTNNYVAYNVNGMILTINGAESAVYNGETYNAVDGVITIEGLTTGRGMPAAFAINAAEGATASFSYPAGHPSNPATLVIGENTATVEANSWDGYVFNWTATADGELKLVLPAEGWQYSLTNLTTGVTGDLMDYTMTNAEHVYAVSEGDQIQLMVNSFDANDPWNTPAASITFNAELITAPACDHTMVYTDNGDGTHTHACACGENSTTAAHTYTYGACVCGAVTTNANLKINLTAVNLESYIGASFRIYAPAANRYDRVFLRVVHNGETYDIVDNLGSEGQYWFQYTMYAMQMTDEIQLTPYGVFEGENGAPDVLVPGAVMSWSVRSSAIESLDANNVDGNTAAQAALSKLLVCLLKYGEEAQIQFNYNLSDLATAGVDAKHLALLPTEAPVINDNSSDIATGSTGSYFDAGYLSLEEKIVLQLLYVFPAGFDKNDYEAQIKYNDVTYTIDGADFIDVDGKPRRKFITFDVLEAKDMRSLIEITIYNKTTQTAASAIKKTSVESLAAGSTSTLIYAVMNYSDAAAAYFAAQ